MRHWIDELSNREENREAKAKAQLSQLAFARIRECIEKCLEIYNRRHPTTASQSIKPDVSSDGMLMRIIVRNRPAWGGFQFIAGKPEFTRYRFSEGEQLEDQGEVDIDKETGTMQMMFDRTITPIENVVRGTLQSVLFPAIQITRAEGTPEYYY